MDSPTRRTRRARRQILIACAAGVLTVTSLAFSQTDQLRNSPPQLRPPAVPLITFDPYVSIWSMSDKLTDDWTRHWTGAVQALVSIVRIDGKPYRVMGISPERVPALPQIGLRVLPTRTTYEFDTAGVHLTLTFMTPLLPYDLRIMSRPVTYLTWSVRSTDVANHDVSIYYDQTAELVVNTPDQKVIWSRHHLANLTVLRMGSLEQPVLQKSGDDLRIDWGYIHLGAPENNSPSSVITGHGIARSSFSSSGKLPSEDDLRMPRSANDDWPVLAIAFELGRVGKKPVERHVLVAYDEEYCVEFLDRRLRPYWRRDGAEVSDLLKQAESDYNNLRTKCEQFDEDVTADLRLAGGEKYVQIASLAYRQCFAAHTLAADIDGSPLLFPKENFSNGCISTVDVIYPSSPFFLLFNPGLLKAALNPIFAYASSTRWRFPFAPHDLGTFPLANGQVYGGGEKTAEDQMPVEECGNLLLMAAAVSKADGNTEFVSKYWNLLSKWADYLRAKGFDPENQLCTDDFAGHLAHNTNLSAKAILAVGAYSTLCEKIGKQKEAERYHLFATESAAKWLKMAGDGNHYRLAFDKPQTWSQKYNLIWDKILGLNIFPDSATAKEIAYYRTKQNRYGLPLDNRKDYTKLDWLIWSAALAHSQSDFQELISPICDFINQSPSRVPLTDWYWTTDAKQVGFQARSVVGGVFIKMLGEPTLWKKWAGKAR